MRKLLFVFSTVLLASGPNSALAVEIAALDFTNNGSAWSVTAYEPDLPLLFEKDDDPTKVGFEHPNTEFIGHYSLTQQVFAPAGFAMDNIRLEALASGFSSWIMDGRVGFGLEEKLFPLQYKYGMAASIGVDNENNGKVVVDYEVVLDSTGDLDFPPTPAIYVSVEVVKLLPQVSQNADVSQIKIFADLTAVPPGDFDFDTDVDGADFLIWQQGGSPNPLSASDLALWDANFSTAVLSAVASIPEPNTGALLAVAATLALVFRRGGLRW